MDAGQEDAVVVASASVENEEDEEWFSDSCTFLQNKVKYSKSRFVALRMRSVWPLVCPFIFVHPSFPFVVVSLTDRLRFISTKYVLVLIFVV